MGSKRRSCIAKIEHKIKFWTLYAKELASKYLLKNLANFKALGQL
jgi:hypothetical protein